MWKLFDAVLLCVSPAVCWGGGIFFSEGSCDCVLFPGVGSMAGPLCIGDQLILEEEYNESYIPKEEGEHGSSSQELGEGIQAF